MGNNNPDDEERAAPGSGIWGSWGAWYAVVLGVLAALVLAFTVLGRVYR